MKAGRPLPQCEVSELARTDRERPFCLKAQSFWEFDEHVTAPLHGFDGASDYYFRSSSIRHLKDISCQTLLLQAKDDPMLGAACYPSSDQISSTMTVLHTEFGGHVGWVNGKPWKMKSWMQEKVFQFLDHHYSNSV